MSLVVIDIQEKLAPHIADINNVLKNTKKLILALKALDVPVVVTEQIKLGRTVDEIAELTESRPIVKSTFSCFKSEEFRNSISGRRVVLTGIETHICVLQTAIDMKKEGYDVYVAADCTGSRRGYDREIALKRMQSEGIKLTTSESIIYELMETAEHPAFKEVLNIVKSL
ncbi:hydrolase [Archaeoglobus neptunius]|uniref:hydrolase n=1 Tax=Archaeoglobus neptunius TaxID=2798580 RepID=UPI001928AA82|nr:hydrolase [Archaeoglobus neptunius]